MTQSTTDYKQFKFLIDNRATATAHINKLKDAIEKNPNILEVQPILVNEKMEIIDGQHRFEAAKQLKLPIHYNMVENLDIETARQMNAIHKRWGLQDYAHSYAKAGNVHYKAYLKYQEEHPSLSSTVVQYVMAGAHNDKLNTAFKEGKFVAGRGAEDIDFILSAIDEIRDITGHEVPFSRTHTSALCIALDKHEDFDIGTIIANLKQKPELFHRVTVNKEAFRMYEDIHNFRKQKDLIRLY